VARGPRQRRGGGAARASVADLAGAPLLTAVHPGDDLAELLTGLAHVHTTGRNAMIRVRLRPADGGWLWCRATLASLDDPPRFAFTLRPFPGAAGGRSERAATSSGIEGTPSGAP
jgi:hypothetical protein